MISPIDEILAELRAGRMVVLMDDEDRENEGDLVMAAQCVRAEHVNFMAKHGRGLICLTLTPERCEQLALPLMVDRNRAPLATNFTVSIEAAQGVTTGISAADRATTIAAAVAQQASPDDIIMPGHVFPLMAQPGGVLVRAGHTEAACDLARLAGFSPSGVICEILNDDGSMARLPDLLPYAQQHALKIGTIADLIAWRRLREPLIERVATSPWPTLQGEFVMHAYRSHLDQQTHLALVWGDPAAAGEVLVRVQAQSALEDLFGRRGVAMDAAIEAISKSPCGVLVYIGRMQQDLLAQVQDQALRQRGLLTEPDPGDTLRDYGIGAQILADLGVRRVILLRNNQTKLPAIHGFGLEVVGQRAC